MTSRTSRLLTLLTLLQARRDWPGRLLSERLDISPRTVRRDVDRLREMGYRIQAIKGPDGGYRLGAGSELPPLLFDADQALALGVALRTASASGAEIGEAALRALATVRQVMPAGLRARLDSFEVTTLAGAAQRQESSVDPEALLSISAAIAAGESLRFDYRSLSAPPDGDSPPRRVEPHHLVVSNGRWYLVGWDPDLGDWRIFRVDRMGLRSHTGARFARRSLPGGDVQAYVSARFKGSETADRWPCEGEAVVSLPLRRVAPFIGDGVAEAVDEGRTRVRLGAWSWIALAASLGRFDAAVEVVGPPELRQAFAELAERFASTATG